MTTHNEPSIARRPFLKGAGVTLATLGGMSGSAVAGGRGGSGGRPRQLEEGSSNVDYVIFAGADGLFANQTPSPDDGADGDVMDPMTDFGFPILSVAVDEDDDRLFDTTIPSVTPNGDTLHYYLQFGMGQPKPYILLHEGGGTYTSRGGMMNFEWTGDGRLALPLPPGKYRGVVRDVVQLYEPGGYFDWSVTRTDFFRRQRGMHHAISLLYVVWDEDGEDNETPTDRGDPGTPGSPAGAPDFPDPTDVTPTVDGRTILPVAQSLIASGVANPGGQ